MQDFNEQVIDQYRANDGELTDGPLAGVPLLLLTHKGARTGRVRTTPLGYYDDAGTPVVFASGMGAPKDPQWVHNVREYPGVAVELGAHAFSAVARIVEGPERDALWLRLIEDKPFLVEHQSKAAPREIPLIRLEQE